MEKIKVLLKEDNLKIRKYLQENIMQEYDNVEISFINQMNSADLYNYVMKQYYENNVDIFPLFLDSLELYLKRDLLVDLKPILKQLDFLKTANKATFAGYDFNKSYTIPYVPYHVGLVYYNTALFEKCKITKTPKTYQEFLDICQVLKDNDIIPFSASFADSWSMSILLYTLIGNENPFILTEIKEKKKTFQDISIINALDKLKELINKKYIDLNLACSRYYNNLEMYFNNKLAMIMDMSYGHINKAIRLFDRSNYFFLPTDDNFTYANFAVSNYKNYSQLGIIKNDKDSTLKCKIALSIAKLYGKFTYYAGDYRPQIFNNIKLGWPSKIRQPYNGTMQLINDGNHLKYTENIDDSYLDKDRLIKIIFDNLDKESSEIVKLLDKANLVIENKEIEEEIIKTVYYENNKIVLTPNYEKSVIEISKTKAYDLLTNHPHGYSLQLPTNLKIDMSLATCGIKCIQDDLYIRISYEKTVYDTSTFVDEYVYKYYRNKNYLKTNDFEVIEDSTYFVDGRKIDYVCINYTKSLNKDNYSYYIYATMTIDTYSFITVLIRTNNYLKHVNDIKTMIHSIKIIPQIGKLEDSQEFVFKMPEVWNEQTRTFYNQYKDKKDVDWGLFHPQSHNDYQHISKIEEALDYKFPSVMYYESVQYSLPFEALRKAYVDRGQYVVFTLHVCEGNNEDTFDKNYCFEMLEGLWDDKFRSWAKDVKKFNKPLIIRMSNEMNTDWTKYAGPLLFSDPENFISLWKRVYNIFMEEKVDNAIFAINGYDRDFPPLSWNSQIAYFPGSDYCQIIGLTGYNAGEYNSYENWRDFATIYDPLVTKIRKYFKDYCWILGEFGSSSFGGDKEKWIEDCFKYLKHTPEIKTAIWFNFADYDGNPERNNIAARSFWLDDNINHLNTFKKLIKKSNKDN